MLDELLDTGRIADGTARNVGLSYFSLGIPCPFLEDESCSIYHDRPVVCREYLVTSPAINCASPSPESVQRVPLPFRIWTAVAACAERRGDAKYLPWVPLSLAPEWATTHAEETASQSGPDLLRKLFEFITKKNIPEPS